jgi:hypothetical protein
MDAIFEKSTSSYLDISSHLLKDNIMMVKTDHIITGDET